MRALKGVGVLILEVLQIAASNPNCLPSYTVSWSPNLSETYQLERSVNSGAWAIIYTGTALSFAQSNLAEAVYSYRVKVVGEAEYSNTVSITVLTQNLIVFQGCLNPGVAPYTYRVTTRTGCGTLTNVDTPNDTRCGYVEGICPGTTQTAEPGISARNIIEYEIGTGSYTKICVEASVNASASCGVVLFVDNVEVGRYGYGTSIDHVISSFSGAFNGRVVAQVWASGSNAFPKLCTIHRVSWD